jgi:hypothetical protein
MVIGMIVIFVLNQVWTSIKERKLMKDKDTKAFAPKEVEEDED